MHNAFYDDDDSGGEGREACVRACRIIEADEEITVNYNSFAWSSDPMPCTCKALECNKVVRGFKWLPQHKKEELISKGEVDDFIVALHYRGSTNNKPAVNQVQMQVLSEPSRLQP